MNNTCRVQNNAIVETGGSRTLPGYKASGADPYSWGGQERGDDDASNGLVASRFLFLAFWQAGAQTAVGTDRVTNHSALWR